MLFSSLGPPWPKHDCLGEWERSLKKTVDHTAGKITVQLSEHTFASRTVDPTYREDDTFGIEQEVIDRALRFDKPSNRVVKRTPKSSTHSLKLAGVVREIRPKVDAFKQLRVDRTAVGSAMLGELSEPIWGRITVHVPDGEGIGSYTLWIESVALSDLDLRRGNCVEFHVVAQAVPKGRDNLEWMLQEICFAEDVEL